MKKTLLWLIPILLLAVLFRLQTLPSDVVVSALDQAPHSAYAALLEEKPVRGTIYHRIENPDDVTLTSEKDGVILKGAHVAVQATTDVVVHHVEGFTFREGDNTLTLQGMALDYGPATDADGKFPERIFAPDGTPVSREEMWKQLNNNPNAHYDSKSLYLRKAKVLPGFTTWLKIDAPDGWQGMDMKLYDARTGNMLGISEGIGGSKSQWRMDTQLTMLHQGPVHVVVDIAWGPYNEYELPAREGAKVKLAHTSVRMLAVRDGGLWANNVQAGSDGFDAQCNLQASPVMNASYLILNTNPGGPFLEIMMREPDGTLKALTNLSNNLIGWSTKEPVDPDRTFIIRGFEQTKRVIFTLPEIPGLSEQNRGITNLAEARIPQITIKSPGGLGMYATLLLQKKYFNEDNPIETDLSKFPMVLEDVSPKEMLAMYMKLDKSHKVLIGDQQVWGDSTVLQRIAAKLGL